MTVTGRAPVILAPLICDPTTTTSSTSDSDSSCAKRKVIGNVNKDHILNIWNNEQFKNVRQRLLNKDRNAKPCEKCNVNGLHVGKEFSNMWQKFYK